MKKATAKFEKLTIPTYRPGAPENLPMFFEKKRPPVCSEGTPDIRDYDPVYSACPVCFRQPAQVSHR